MRQRTLVPALVPVLALLLAAPARAQQPAAITTDSAVASPVFLGAARLGPALPRLALAPIGGLATTTDDSTPRARPQAVQLSDAYYARLTIHRWTSYATVPLFAAQYVLGERLIDRRDRGEDDGSVQGLHGGVAGTIAGLFAINTVTGGWNLWEARHVKEGRVKRTVHTVGMLLAEAGFLATAATAEGASDEAEGEDEGSASTHRGLAIGSIGVALGSAALMWFWKD